MRLWQDKDAQLVASREAMAEGLAKGPAVQVATIAQGPKERLITLLGDTRPYQVATLYGKVGGYLKSIDGRSRRSREGGTGAGARWSRRRPIGNTMPR